MRAVAGMKSLTQVSRSLRIGQYVSRSLRLGVVFLVALATGASLSLEAAPKRPANLDQLAPADFDRAAAAHLLSRAGFGGTPREIDQLVKLGLDGAVDRLLQTGGDDPVGDFQATIMQRPGPMQFMGLSSEERQKLTREHRQKDQQQFQRLRAWWLQRMVLTPRPLEEKMTLFWHGHFATSQVDVRNSYHMYLQNQTLRENAFGNFKELVTAVAQDPAMLEYLDNNTNNRNRPNENFARELMELFTLGVGNYTEEDIKEAARALTGWTLRGNEFVFARFQHDPGEKTFLGQKGRFTGDDVIGIIFEQPAASRFVVRKMFVYFAHEDPSDEVIESLAATFREHDFEIQPVLAELFRSSEFYSQRSRGSQIQSPVQLVVRTLRLLELDPGTSPLYAGVAGQMGQELFAPPSVKGWDGGENWISTSTLFDRRNYPILMLGLAPPEAIKRQARGRQGGRFTMPQWNASSGAAQLLGKNFTQLTAEEAVDRLLERFLLVPATDDAREKLIELYNEKQPASRLPELIHLIVSSPQYQLG